MGRGGMTAMNLIVQERAKAAFLLTDTAYYRFKDGAVMYFGPKVTGLMIGEGAYAAIATSGTMFSSHIGPQLGALRAGSLREVLASMPDVFKAAEAASKAEGGKGAMAAAVAVFDPDRCRAGGFIIGNGQGGFPQAGAPYRLISTKKHLTEMGEQHDEFLCQTDFCDPASWSPERDGAALMDAQRTDLFDLGPGVRAPAVGGQAILTRVDKSGISHTTLKTWPDRVGRPINLGSGDRLAWRHRLEAWGRENFRPAPTIRVQPA